MANRASIVNSKQFRDAIVAVHLGKVKLRSVAHVYDVPKRQVEKAIDDLETINQICLDHGQEKLLETNKRKQVHRWASKYAKANVGDSSTFYEKRHALFLDSQGYPLADIYEEFGVGSSTHKLYQLTLAKLLGYENMKEVRNAVKTKYITLSNIKKYIDMIPMYKKGRPTALLPDEEALLVANLEMYASAGQTRSISSLANRVTNIINECDENLGKGAKFISKKHSIQRARRILQRVNQYEPSCENKKGQPEPVRLKLLH